MAHSKSLLNKSLTRVIRAPSRPKKSQKDVTNNSDMIMETFMKSLNPHGNALKIFPPVFDILIHSRPTTRIVMGFLFENIKQGTHLVDLHWQKFVKKGYGSRDTFYRGIVDLKERNMIQKKSGQTYEINPDFVFKGNIAKFLMNVSEARNE